MSLDLVECILVEENSIFIVHFPNHLFSSFIFIWCLSFIAASPQLYAYTLKVSARYTSLSIYIIQVTVSYLFGRANGWSKTPCHGGIYWAPQFFSSREDSRISCNPIKNACIFTLTWNIHLQLLLSEAACTSCHST